MAKNAFNKRREQRIEEEGNYESETWALKK